MLTMLQTCIQLITFSHVFAMCLTRALHYFTCVFPGNKVLVRCLKLLKPYTKKGVTDDDDDEDEEEEDETGARLRSFPPLGRIMEKDFLSQAYHLGMFDHCLLKGTEGK